MYHVCSGQGLVVKDEGVVIKNTCHPGEVPLCMFFSSIHLDNSL